MIRSMSASKRRNGIGLVVIVRKRRQEEDRNTRWDIVHSEEDCHCTTQLTKVRPANHDLLEGGILENCRGENVHKVILQVTGLVH